MSKDGFISRIDGDIDWILELNNPDKTDYGIKSFLDSIDTIVMNNNHYQILLGYDLCFSCMTKPVIMISSNQDFKISGGYEIKYVVSEPNDYLEAVSYMKELKCNKGGDIWLAGDNKLIHSLLQNNLVDEIVLTRVPVSIGSGVKLFPNKLNFERWKRICSLNYKNGVIQLTFRVTETAKSSPYD